MLKAVEHARPDAKADVAKAAETASPRQESAESAVLAAPGVRDRRLSSPRSVIALQRRAGNQAVAKVVADAVQRITVDASTAETLYNRESATGQATAGHYSVSGNYEMTRQGDTGVTVTVRIKFLNQQRNTVPPTPPATTPRLGSMIGSPTEIPAGDPRRTWATDMAQAAVANWNGRLFFNGVERNIIRANANKRLPVTFRAEPVFAAGDAANAQVVVHPPSSIGGAQGHPIDAGNWYAQRNPNVYPAEEHVIYAHEYGHLLGIPDEYSQSNRQMHLLLHQASPTGAANAMGALNRTTVERMALAAVTRPLMARLNSSMPAVAAAIQAQQPVITRKMTAAARAGVRDAGVTAALVTGLENASEARLHRAAPRTAAFQTTTNFSARTRALEGVGQELASPALTTRITGVYQRALREPHSQAVAVEGLGDVRVNMSSSVSGLGSGTAAAAPSAAGVATSTVGPAPVPAPAGGAAHATLPAIAPASSLVGQLTALPRTWSAAGSALDSAVTPAAFAARMQATLTAANIAESVRSLIPGVAAAPKIDQVRALYRRAYEVVRNASVAVSRQIMSDLLASTLNPILTASVTALQAQIQAEVTRVMGTPPGALAAATPDPSMVGLVAAMKARLEASQAATASVTSRDPLGAGAAAPDQDVTYSYQGLMGSNRTTALRSDQFAPMLRQFNENLKSIWETAFTSETV